MPFYRLNPTPSFPDIVLTCTFYMSSTGANNGGLWGFYWKDDYASSRMQVRFEIGGKLSLYTVAPSGLSEALTEIGSYTFPIGDVTGALEVSHTGSTIIVKMNGVEIINVTNSYLATYTGFAGPFSDSSGAIGSAQPVEIYAMAMRSDDVAGGLVLGFADYTATATIAAAGYNTTQLASIPLSGTADAIAVGNVVPVIMDVVKYRFKDTTGLEPAVPWLAAEDTPLEVNPAVTRSARLRFLVQSNSGLPASGTNNRLQYRIGGTFPGAWQDINVDSPVSINAPSSLKQYTPAWSNAFHYCEEVDGFLSLDESTNTVKLMEDSYAATVTSLGAVSIAGTIFDAVFASDGTGKILMVISFELTASVGTLRLGWTNSSDAGLTWSAVTDIGATTASTTTAAPPFPNLTLHTDGATSSFIVVAYGAISGNFAFVESTSNDGTAWGTIVEETAAVTLNNYRAWVETSTSKLLFKDRTANITGYDYSTATLYEAIPAGGKLDTVQYTFGFDGTYYSFVGLSKESGSGANDSPWLFYMRYPLTLDAVVEGSLSLDTRIPMLDTVTDSIFVDYQSGSSLYLRAYFGEGGRLGKIRDVQCVYNMSANTLSSTQTNGWASETTETIPYFTRIQYQSRGNRIALSSSANGAALTHIKVLEPGVLTSYESDSTQQLGVGAFAAINGSVVSGDASPRYGLFDKYPIAANTEFEAEYTLVFNKLPSLNKIEFRLSEEPRTVEPAHPFINMSNHFYVNANLTFDSGWTTNGNWSFGEEDAGSGNTLPYVSQSLAAGLTATASKTFYIYKPARFVVYQTSKKNGADLTPSGGSTLTILIDGLQDSQFDISNSIFTYGYSTLLSPGVYTIEVQLFLNGDGFLMEAYIGLFGLEYDNPESVNSFELVPSYNSFNHIVSYPYIANTTIAAKVMAGATVSATGSGQVFISGAISMLSDAFSLVVGTQLGSILGAVGMNTTSDMTGTAQVGQDEQGVVAMSASATFVSTGTIYYTSTEHFRFRNDDGDETTATWLAPTDTRTSSITPGNTYRVRFAVENFGLTTGFNTTVGSMEIKTNNGAWGVIGFNDNDTAVANVLSTNTLLGTVTPADTSELDYNKECIMFIDSANVWHLLYSGKQYYTQGAYYANLAHRRSINQGSTWSAPVFFPGENDTQSNLVDKTIERIHILETSAGGLAVFWTDAMTADQSGLVFTLTSFLSVFSNSNGSSWSAPEIVGILRNPNYVHLSNSVNDLIVVGVSNGFPRVDVSTNDGSTWNSLDYNDDTGVVATDVECVYAYAELQPNDDLDIYYAMPTFSGGTSYGTMKLYKYTMAHPYSGWPALVGGDDSARLVFESTTTLDAVSPFNYDEGFMYRTPNNLYYVWPFDDVKHAALVEDNGVWRESTWPFNISTIWDSVEQSGARGEFMPPLAYNNGERMLRARGNFYARPSVDGDTPGVLGWYRIASGGALGSLSDSSTFLFHSPTSGKWHACSMDLTLNKLSYYELTWTSVLDGGDTTQQISTETFETPNKGMAPYNVVDVNTASQLSSGNVAEYEYSFALRPTKAVSGDTVCMRPSGWDTGNTPACFTIVAEEVKATASASVIASGFTDGPKSAMTVTATVAALGGLVQPALINAIGVCSIAAAHDFVKNSPVIMGTTSDLTGSVYITKLAASSMLVAAYVDMVSINIKRVSASITSTAALLILEPTIETPAKANLLSHSFVYPTAVKGLEAATSIHSYALLRAQHSTTDLCISVTVYESPNTLTVVQDSPLNIVDIPATLTISQPPVPDLVIAQEPPLQVYLYE